MMGCEWGPGLRVAVIGAAATGVAVADVLGRRGATVTLLERRPLDQLPAELRNRWAEFDGVRLLSTQSLPEGTDVVVPSPGVRATAEPILQALRAGIPVVSEIEIAWDLSPAPVLAVTGTNGKTTTTAMLSQIVAASGLRAWTCGNLAADNGERFPMICAAEQASSNDVLVAEVSSFQLEWVHRFRPRGAAWLNLSEDHGDAYPDRESYAAAKRRILEAQQPSDVAVLNHADAWVRRYAEGAGSGRRVWFDGRAPEFPGGVHVDPASGLLRGLHQRSNAVAAAWLAAEFGIDADAIGRGIAGFQPVPHRMEDLGQRGGIGWINNSMCTNLAAVDASLSAVDRPVVAIVGGRGKGASMDALAEVVARRSRAAVLIGETAEALSAAMVRLDHPFAVAADMESAVVHAAAMASPGDVVVLSPGCSSFDQYSGFEERGRAFRDAVARWSGK